MSTALIGAGGFSLLSIRVKPKTGRGHVKTAAAAKLPYGQGDSSPRKISTQTQATNPAVSASAMVQPDLVTERQHLEKLYTFDGSLQVDTTPSEATTDQALQDVEALLQDLQGLDAELESALEGVKEDFSELTVSLLM
jgi:hypothetical protein